MWYKSQVLKPGIFYLCLKALKEINPDAELQTRENEKPPHAVFIQELKKT